MSCSRQSKVQTDWSVDLFLAAGSSAADRGQAEAKCLRPRPRPKLWGRDRDHFGLEDLTPLRPKCICTRATAQNPVGKPHSSGGSMLEQGYNCTPSFWLCTPSWQDASNKKLSLRIILLCSVNWNAWESEICPQCITDDAWWNFHVWKFHKLMGRPNRDGQLRRLQRLWSIAPPVLQD